MLFPNFSALCFIFSFSPAFTVMSIRSYVFELYFLLALVADVPMLSPPQTLYHFWHTAASISF
nr:MAG TPA: hypothetical protein [Caudoviricetes sp.]